MPRSICRTVGLLLVARATVAFAPPRLASPPCARDVARMAGMPLVPYKPPGSDYTQFIDIYSRLYRDRIMLIGSFLDEEQCNNIIAVLLYLKYEDPNKQISLYFNSPGALMKPCLAVYDTMQSLECPISTLNMGLATGMGAFLCGAGTKGMRYALPNARFLMQRAGLDDPYQGQASDIGLMVRENLRDNERTERALSEITGRAPLTVQEEMQRDFYLSSSEAVQYGLIDRVLLPTADDKVRYQSTSDGLAVAGRG